MHNPTGESFLRAARPAILDLPRQLTSPRSLQQLQQEAQRQFNDAAATEDALSGVAFLFADAQ